MLTTGREKRFGHCQPGFKSILVLVKSTFAIYPPGQVAGGLNSAADANLYFWAALLLNEATVCDRMQINGSGVTDLHSFLTERSDALSNHYVVCSQGRDTT